MGGVIYITTKKGLEKGKTFTLITILAQALTVQLDGSLTLSGSNNHFYYALHGDSHHTKGISALSNNRFNYTAQDGTAVSTWWFNRRESNVPPMIMLLFVSAMTITKKVLIS